MAAKSLKWQYIPPKNKNKEYKEYQMANGFYIAEVRLFLVEKVRYPEGKLANLPEVASFMRIFLGGLIKPGI